MTEHESLLFGVEMMRDELAGQLAALGRIRDDRRYTAEHRAELLKAQLAEAWGVAGRRITSERQDVEVTRKQAEKALAKARHVEPGVLADRAAVLSPMLTRAAQDPNVLITAYINSFDNLVDRRLIEETAQVMMAAEAVPPGFAESWQRAGGRVELPEVEQEALAQLETAAEQHEYLSAVEGLSSLELRQAAGAPVEGIEHIRAASLAATVHRYENTGTTKITQEVQTIA
jgi:hypothetical protein